MNTSELVKLIDPKLSPSYSPNLHKYVKKYAKHIPEAWLPQVYRDEDSTLWIGYIDPDVPKTDKGGLVGVRLARVLCTGSKAYKEKGWWICYGPGNLEHIKNFWERYIAIGRCAIDTDHTQCFIGDKDRYTMEGDLRTCTWCGAQHKRRIEIKTYTKEIEHFDVLVTGD